MVSKAQKRAARMAAAQTPSAPAVEPKAPAASAAPTPKVVSKVVGTLKVKDGMKFRGARDEWYKVLQAHDGKPAQEYLEATTKTPPSLPKSGKQEPSSGWLRWFVRHEVATIQVEKTK